jgi:uncharacterized membrane protein YfcA
LIYWVYVLVSAAGGLLVGVLGTGSSLLLLPSLTLIFTAADQGPDPLRLAAGTTMATIAVGAIAGAIAQYRHGQVDLKLFRLTLLPYTAGGLAGPWLGRLLPEKALGLYVAGVIACVAVAMLRDGAERARATRRYESHRFEVSAVPGVASGIFAIPYLSRFALPLRHVIGTSTAAAAVYAVSGALGYVSAGLDGAVQGPATFGYVYLPAFAAMAVTALVFTPLGVRLASRVSEPLLKKIFAAFLMLAAAALIVLA